MFRSRLQRATRASLPTLYFALAIAWILNIGLHAQEVDEFEQFQQQQQQQFGQFADQFARDYQSFVEADQAAFQRFKDQVEQQWGQYRGSSRKDWVEYGENLDSRSQVDFEAGAATVEVIVEGNAEEARAKLEKAVTKLIGDQGRSADYSVPLPDGTTHQPQPLAAKPILAGQVAAPDGTPVTPANAADFAQQVVRGTGGGDSDPGNDKVVVDTVTGKDGQQRVRARAVFPLIPDHLRQRAQRYLPQVRVQAKRFGLEVPLVFAVIHTESFFNPKARSGAPAYGLMQLVPTSGGRDAYRFVYDKDQVLPTNYFYQPEQNIELGCAYLNVLRTRYFGKLEDDRKALYCSVAGYNTGAGNVSKAFTGNTAIRKAIPSIQAMETQQVYDHLRAKLPYEETRSYLKKVIERMEIYEEWR
ncbi:MAG: DUF3393 domain-containing protein [Candidatus Latescibacteria bacterium]|nr:DUF3393 domain-containing protein [Candidatus Latescibacterota bacterium]